MLSCPSSHHTDHRADGEDKVWKGRFFFFMYSSNVYDNAIKNENNKQNSEEIIFFTLKSIIINKSLYPT